MMQRWKERFARFMYGRYGPDQLNNVMLILGVALAVIGMLFSLPLGFFLYRMFSRNANRRRLENQRFMQLLNRLRDRESRYYSCPRCHQTVRVPRGRGIINIHCPKCGNQFIKKT